MLSTSVPSEHIFYQQIINNREIKTFQEYRTTTYVYFLLLITHLSTNMFFVKPHSVHLCWTGPCCVWILLDFYVYFFLVLFLATVAPGLLKLLGVVCLFVCFYHLSGGP